MDLGYDPGPREAVILRRQPVKRKIGTIANEIVEGENMKVDKRSQIDLALLQLSGTHILNERQRSGKSKYKVRLVQGSCVTCTEVGGKCLTWVEEICPPTINPPPL